MWRYVTGPLTETEKSQLEAMEMIERAKNKKRDPGVIVQPAKGNDKPNFASAHDLRRSCAERLTSAGVPEREVAKVLRHSDVQTTGRFYAPGTVQESAGFIRYRLGSNLGTSGRSN